MTANSSHDLQYLCISFITVLFVFILGKKALRYFVNMNKSYDTFDKLDEIIAGSEVAKPEKKKKKKRDM